jgi:hypothetical protein
MTRSAITEESTAPNEKKTESAVTRYCLRFGICSMTRVPSVGMDPFGISFSEQSREEKKCLTPTAVPRRKRSTQREGNELANEASSPNTEVNNRVPLNAALRPKRSEPSPSTMRDGAVWKICSHKCPSLQRQTSFRRTSMTRRYQYNYLGLSQTVRECMFIVNPAQCNGKWTSHAQRRLTIVMLLHTRQDDSHCLHPHLNLLVKDALE